MVKPIPDGYHSVTPYLIVKGAARALEFYKKAFNATEIYRFEGVSDPDDMAIVYAIESRDGTRGTLVDAFGVYSDPAVSTVVESIPVQRVA